MLLFMHKTSIFVTFASLVSTIPIDFLQLPLFCNNTLSGTQNVCRMMCYDESPSVLMLQDLSRRGHPPRGVLLISGYASIRRIAKVSDRCLPDLRCLWTTIAYEIQGIVFFEDVWQSSLTSHCQNARFLDESKFWFGLVGLILVSDLGASDHMIRTGCGHNGKVSEQTWKIRARHKNSRRFQICSQNWLRSPLMSRCINWKLMTYAKARNPGRFN